MRTRWTPLEQDRLALKTIEQGRHQEQLAELDNQIAAVEQRISHLTLHAPAAGIVLTDGLERLSGNRMFPVLVRLSREDLEAVGLDPLRRGYTPQAKIVTRNERMLTLMWEYLLRRSEEVREKTKRRVEQDDQAGRAP